MEKSIRLDDRMESYRSFFDHGWSKLIYRLAGSTALEESVFDLGRAWKAAANTHVLPWLMAQQLKHFHAGLMQMDEPFATQFVSTLLARLSRDAEGSIPLEVVDQLRTLLREVAFELGVNQQRNSDEFNLQEVWRQFLGQPEFRLSLWGSQRLAYGAVYFAYEDFLLRSFKLTAGKAKYQIQGKKFGKDFADEFGTALRDECWSHSQVSISRLTRHALVHNGGRLTDNLKKLNHGLCVEGDEIQILAPDTKALYDLLKVRALWLTEHIVRRASTDVVES